jgi:hypothetical protein
VRLQLICGLLLVARAALADPGAEATMRVYTDDDGMTIVSPAVDVEVTRGASTIDVDAVADVITGASIDVVTSASPTPIDEQRVEAGIGLQRAMISASVRGSHERDHDAARASVGLRRELLGRQLALDARATLGLDAIGSAMDPSFDRTRSLASGTLGATVVGDPRTLWDVLVEATRLDGYQASPYRRVPLDRMDSPIPRWVDEHAPGLRLEAAAAVRVRRAIGDAWFASLTYRGYHDDWSVTSHTGSVELRRQLGDRWLAGATLRGYTQTRASFYRASYDAGAPPTWRTRDRTLGPMRSWFASLTADAALDAADRWRAVAAAGVLGETFPEFPLQRERHALVLTISISRAFDGGDP